MPARPPLSGSPGLPWSPGPAAGMPVIPARSRPPFVPRRLDPSGGPTPPPRRRSNSAQASAPSRPGALFLLGSTFPSMRTGAARSQRLRRRSCGPPACPILAGRHGADRAPCPDRSGHTAPLLQNPRPNQRLQGANMIACGLIPARLALPAVRRPPPAHGSPKGACFPEPPSPCARTGCGFRSGQGFTRAGAGAAGVLDATGARAQDGDQGDGGSGKQAPRGFVSW